MSDDGGGCDSGGGGCDFGGSCWDAGTSHCDTSNSHHDTNSGHCGPAEHSGTHSIEDINNGSSDHHHAHSNSHHTNIDFPSVGDSYLYDTNTNDRYSRYPNSGSYVRSNRRTHHTGPRRNARSEKSTFRTVCATIIFSIVTVIVIIILVTQLNINNYGQVQAAHESPTLESHSFAGEPLADNLNFAEYFNNMKRRFEDILNNGTNQSTMIE